LEESTDGQKVGVSIEAKMFTVSPRKGTGPSGPPINKSGGSADGELPTSTRAVKVLLTRKNCSSDGSIPTT